MELPKTYNPKDVEDKIYEQWEKSGFFNPDNLEKADERFWNAEPFSIAMPPPNVTGQLHIGHAMYTLQDLMIRHARMSGKKALWLPGTDHAAIATQNVVERQIWETEQKTRHDLGREELLRRIEIFVTQTKGNIQNQLRKLGFSCDWSREKYTLSPEMSVAVRTAFKKMYDAGLIYRGERIVNWCPRCGTTLADDEVVYKTEKAKMYYIRYPVKGSRDHLVVATVRPETMLGDTAVAVNPKDPRYKKFIGKSVILPLLNRELTIIADDHIDPEFGTGAMKVTPGHDMHDFEIGQRNSLDTINLFTLDGKIDVKEAADHGFDDYAGLTAEQAREKIVKVLETQHFLEKTEDIEHNVGSCYRCGTTVEPIISKQWFVSVDKKFKFQDKDQSLKEMMTAAVESGSIEIVPSRFKKTYAEWMKNLRDWNISRQIWFGHRVPVWYKGDEIYCGVEPPAGEGWDQDPDTLDTWFSSGLWSFSTLGWPPSEAGRASPQRGGPTDLQTFHPTTILETGYDILFFWVARMVLMSGFLLGQIPFRSVYLHGLVRDIEGKKMSKSKGNVVNPLEMIEKYGADALRLSLIMGVSPGKDMKISEDKIETYRNFVNKLWNISRFILPCYKNPKHSKDQTLADRWILERLNKTVAEVNAKLASRDFGLAGEALMKFTWDDVADWYLEISKIEGGKEELLCVLLVNILKLWHPFAPFVTEHIWSQMSDDLLMVRDYPVVQQLPEDADVKNQFENLRNLVIGLRTLRAEYRQAPKEILASYLEVPENLSWLSAQQSIVEKLGRTQINFASAPTDKKLPYFLWQGQRVYLTIPDFDPKKELSLAEKDLKQASALAEKLAAQLDKPEFLQQAPPEIVEKLKTDFDSAKQREEKLKDKVQQLK